jgi:tetratricopeptide (TPR) repeat protein
LGHANNGVFGKKGGGGGFAGEGDFGGGRAMPRNMIAMRKVWTRIAAVSAYDGVNDSIKKSVAEYEEALAKNPDSREKHRALVQALSYAGELDKARDVANKWLERDRLDPQALGYIADLAGRNGERDQSLRILAGLVDLDADRVALHERMVNAYERTGRLAQACGHRIAIASIQTKDTGSAASAARCLRTLGRDGDASLVMRGLPDDASRASAEKLATVAPSAPRLAGDLVVNAKWDSGADLDVSLVTPDGTRVSWMGGRSDVIVNDSTSTERESLAVRSLRRGNYLVEITRGDAARSTVHGSLDVTVLGVKKTLPFELTGTHGTVGRVAVTLESHLEPVDGSVGFNSVPQAQMVAHVLITNIPDERTNGVVRARAGIYRACYQRELNRAPATSGRVSLVVAIDDQGTPTVQRTSPNGTNMDAVGQCLSQSISRLRFPAGEAKTFAVAMSFTPN